MKKLTQYAKPPIRPNQNKVTAEGEKEKELFPKHVFNVLIEYDVFEVSKPIF